MEISLFPDSQWTQPWCQGQLWRCTVGYITLIGCDFFLTKLSFVEHSYPNSLNSFFIDWSAFSSQLFNEFIEKGRRAGEEKAVRASEGILVSGAKVAKCQKTLQCWLPCWPDVAVTNSYRRVCEVTSSPGWYDHDDGGMVKLKRRQNQNHTRNEELIYLLILLDLRRGEVPLQVHHADLLMQQVWGGKDESHQY